MPRCPGAPYLSFPVASLQFCRCTTRRRTTTFDLLPLFILIAVPLMCAIVCLRYALFTRRCRTPFTAALTRPFSHTPAVAFSFPYRFALDRYHLPHAFTHHDAVRYVFTAAARVQLPHRCVARCTDRVRLLHACRAGCAAAAPGQRCTRRAPPVVYCRLLLHHCTDFTVALHRLPRHRAAFTRYVVFTFVVDFALHCIYRCLITRFALRFAFTFGRCRIYIALFCRCCCVAHAPVLRRSLPRCRCRFCDSSNAQRCLVLPRVAVDRYFVLPLLLRRTRSAHPYRVLSAIRYAFVATRAFTQLPARSFCHVTRGASFCATFSFFWIPLCLVRSGFAFMGALPFSFCVPFVLHLRRSYWCRLFSLRLRIDRCVAGLPCSCYMPRTCLRLPPLPCAYRLDTALYTLRSLCRYRAAILPFYVVRYVTCARVVAFAALMRSLRYHVYVATVAWVSALPRAL